MNGVYSDEKNSENKYVYPEDVNELTKYVQKLDSNVKGYSGSIDVKDGILLNNDITIIHSRSIAEDITITSGGSPYYRAVLNDVEFNNLTYDQFIAISVYTDNLDTNLYTGSLNVLNGKIIDQVTIEGKSLVSSAELTAKAFSQGILGQYGGKLVAIALLLFAFSTAITWCYYGDRSTAYIFGERGVIWYRNFYVLCFVLAAVIDTTVVWNIAYVVVALVSIPNLIAMFVLRKEMKLLSDDFKTK